MPAPSAASPTAAAASDADRGTAQRFENVEMDRGFRVVEGATALEPLPLPREAHPRPTHALGGQDLADDGLGARHGPQLSIPFSPPPSPLPGLRLPIISNVGRGEARRRSERMDEIGAEQVAEQ